MILTQVKKQLKPGGIFLFDIKTSHCYEETLGNQVWTDETDKGQYIWENIYDREEGINQYCLTIYEQQPGTDLYRRYEEIHEQYRYEADWLKKWAEEEQLKVEGIYQEGLEKKPEKDSDRIYFVMKG